MSAPLPGGVTHWCGSRDAHWHCLYLCAPRGQQQLLHANPGYVLPMLILCTPTFLPHAPCGHSCSVPEDSRLGHIIEWLKAGADADVASPLIIFDEVGRRTGRRCLRWSELWGHPPPPLKKLLQCHKAKNLIPTGGAQATLTALAVVKLQRVLPQAKVLYSSATGASEPRSECSGSTLPPGGVPRGVRLF